MSKVTRKTKLNIFLTLKGGKRCNSSYNGSQSSCYFDIEALFATSLNCATAMKNELFDKVCYGNLQATTAQKTIWHDLYDINKIKGCVGRGQHGKLCPETIQVPVCFSVKQQGLRMYHDTIYQGFVLYYEHEEWNG